MASFLISCPKHTSMSYKVLSFYRYVPLADSPSVRDAIKKRCQELHILGRILLGEQGINGAISGTVEELIVFKELLESFDEFKSMTYRERNVEENAYHKLVVRVRQQICAFDAFPDMKNTGQHITPTQLNELLDTGKEVFLLDARNKHEVVLGSFKNAIHLDIECFREFTSNVHKIDHLKNKKIVMFCTGGIRCELSSAYLKERGFSDVSQLEGGIINYVNQFKNKHYEGGVFVFDDRLLDDTGAAPLSSCVFCATPSGFVNNCHNLDCDALFVSCKACNNKYECCCSVECVQSPRQRSHSARSMASII